MKEDLVPLVTLLHPIYGRLALKDWRENLEHRIDNFRQNEEELLKVIQLCQGTLFEMEPTYIFVRDQRSAIEEWLNEFRRLYVTRFRHDPQDLTRKELQWSEEILDTPQRRKSEVRKIALELGQSAGNDVTDQMVLDELMSRGRRFVAENPKATISTILGGFKEKFTKVEGKRGVFRKRF